MRLEGAGGGDLDVGLGLAGRRAEALNLLDEVLALGDLTEDNVLAVEPRGDNGGDEELRAVGVGAGVSHGEEEGAVVTELEVLVGELVAVDGLAASAVVV